MVRKLVSKSIPIVHHVREGQEYRYSEQAVGTTVTQADTLLYALHLGLDILMDYLTAHNAQAHTKAIIHLPSCFAINRALDANPHEEQQVSINHLHQIDNLLHVFPHMNITLMWLPRSIPFVGFKRAKQHTLKTIHIADITMLKDPHTIKCQKEDTKHQVVKEWMDHGTSCPETPLFTKPPF